jgi:hypothetical protein
MRMPLGGEHQVGSRTDTGAAIAAPVSFFAVCTAPSSARPMKEDWHAMRPAHREVAGMGWATVGPAVTVDRLVLLGEGLFERRRMVLRA